MYVSTNHMDNSTKCVISRSHYMFYDPTVTLGGGGNGGGVTGEKAATLMTAIHDNIYK